MSDRQLTQPGKSTNPLRTLIFGCGYLGKRVAKTLVSSGHPVWGTTRSREKAAMLKRLGIEPLCVDWTDPSTLRNLPEVDRILVAVSYDRDSKISRRDSQVGGLDNLLQEVPPGAPLCYISTTGVYHQTDGQWVDETSAAEPSREGARVHLEAEQLLESKRASGTYCVLRLAGIYGPDRIPRVRDVAAGQPIASRPDSYLNLIHVDDAVRAVIASWEHASQPLYLVSDDHPSLRRDFYCEVASIIGADQPSFIEPEEDASARLRSESNKRIANDAMKRDLVAELKFPDYRTGLADTLHRDDAGGQRKSMP